MNRRSRSIFIGPFLLVISAAVLADPAAPATQPSTRPADVNLRQLIAQLGDADPLKRDAAMKALRQLGPEILPALEVAAADPNPQIGISAETLVAEIKDKSKPPSPAVASNPPGGVGQLQIDANGNIVLNGQRLNRLPANANRMQFHVVFNGQQVRDMTISENGRRIHIREENQAIKVEVTENGETKTYEAKSVEELKEKQPEGYKVYEKYNRSGGPILIEPRMDK